MRVLVRLTLAGVLLFIPAWQAVFAEISTPRATNPFLNWPSTRDSVLTVRPTTAGSRADLKRRAEAVVAAMIPDSLGRTWTQWVASHGAECEPFRGSGFLVAGNDYWAFRCAAELVTGTLTSYFYFLPDQQEPTLERIEWAMGPTSGFPPEIIDSLAVRLVETLTVAWGSAKRVPTERLDDSGSGSWSGLVQFALPTGRLVLYRTISRWPAVDSLVVELSSADLRSARDDLTPRVELGEREESRSREANLHEVSQALPTLWVRLATALRFPRPRAQDLSLVRDALTWAKEHPKSPEEGDLLRYAAHLWLRGHGDLPGWSGGDSAAVRPLRTALLPLGVAIVKTHDGGWCYDEALAESLAGRAGQNRWADLAFLELLDRGWESPCGLCGWDRPFGPDLFQPVIEHGEAYLRTHPGSEVASFVRLRVAEAHETAWSLSKTAPGNDSIDWRKYALGAAVHRAAALELYERALRERLELANPQLTGRLRRLHLDVDTSFHKYWCLWD